MWRDELGDLMVCVVVAEERCLTKAAAKLGTSQSALSYTVRRLELSIRLLTRTTRRVAPTQAGERLLNALGPAFGMIDTELAMLGELREKPAGTVRINTSEHAAQTVLWPALERLLPDYPDIQVELDVDNGPTDIVAGRYDADVRLGEHLAKDMFAVRIGPDPRMTIVHGTAERPSPATLISGQS